LHVSLTIPDLYDAAEKVSCSSFPRKLLLSRKARRMKNKNKKKLQKKKREREREREEKKKKQKGKRGKKREGKILRYRKYSCFS
jgi:hypothetical protein